MVAATALKPNSDTIPPPLFPVDQRTLDTEIGEGRLKVTPALARRILTLHNYERQRPLKHTHVSFLADEMRRGSFLAGTQIAFAKHKDRLILVNGQHRLNAQIESAETVEYQVIIHTAETAADVHRHYYRHDRGGKARSDSEVLASVGIAERFNLSATLTRAVFHAQPLIANGFTRPNHMENVTLRNDDLRLDGCKPWWSSAETFQGLVAPAPASVRKRLYSSQAVAVALVTLKYQPEKAAEFWSGLAKDDGLRRDDPRKALLIDLGAREWFRKSADGSRSTSTAWNAFYQDRPLRRIHIVDGSPVRIAGTPYDGRRR